MPRPKEPPGAPRAGRFRLHAQDGTDTGCREYPSRRRAPASPARSKPRHCRRRARPPGRRDVPRSTAKERTMRRFSLSSLVAQAFGAHLGWGEQWRKASPKASYDAVVIGGGGHGLATAYYLAREHGITNVAVLEKGWIGGGNSGRNTTIVRSNYLYDESAAIYEHSLKLWEGLSAELNYNVMFSQRGILMLAHHHHDVASFRRHRPRQSPQRHRQRVADAGRGQGLLPRARYRAGQALPRPRRRPPAARRHRPPRRRQLGLRPRRLGSRRRHRRELRGARPRARRLRRRLRPRHVARSHRDEARRRLRRRPYLAS